MQDAMTAAHHGVKLKSRFAFRLRGGIQLLEFQSHALAGLNDLVNIGCQATLTDVAGQAGHNCAAPHDQTHLPATAEARVSPQIGWAKHNCSSGEEAQTISFSAPEPRVQSYEREWPWLRAWGGFSAVGAAAIAQREVQLAALE